MNNITNGNLVKNDHDSYMISYKFLNAMSVLTYGTKEDFINDKLNQCLKHGIISTSSAADPIWLEQGIIVEDCSKKEPCMIYDNPYLGLLKYSLGSDEVQYNYWPYSVKKVNLPIGWKLEKGCDCSRHMVPSAFKLIDNNGKTIKTLSFFTVDDELNKPRKQNVLEMIDSVFDEIENGIDNIKTSDNTFTIT